MGRLKAILVGCFVCMIGHQRRHFFLGFMGDPRGHWKARAKSTELVTVPMTLNREGE